MKKWIIRALAALLAAGICICFFALAAEPSPGSQSDPLVSLSYINDVLKPELKEYVDAQVRAKSEALKAEFSEKAARIGSQSGGYVYVSP